jgi:hypothetical protein
MKNINVKKIYMNGRIGKVVIIVALIVLVYLFITIFFANRMFFNTAINGVNVSLKVYDDVQDIIRDSSIDYELQLVERNGEIEKITGQDIGLQYNEKNSIYQIFQKKNSFNWIGSILKKQDYYVNDLFIYNKNNLKIKISELKCLNEDIIEPQNVSFKYSNGAYEVIEEVYGNKIYRDKLSEAIEMSILKGKKKLDLNESHCYENPKYTLKSDKTMETNRLLNEYVSTKVTYIFGKENEVLDENIINQWLSVNENLEVVINEKAIKEYVKVLSKKYDTIGMPRKFKTSTNKIVEIKGGIYGWKINSVDEIKAILKNIKHGEVIKREPIYSQRALIRDVDDIGNTYVEINITRQHLWFYKNGKLLAAGAVVTGNPNRGYSTKVGVYMLNYKEKGSILRGPGYEAGVTYWMPFFGNIGIHDAKWRYSFGGEIYKRRGSHGCVNAPLYLAKRIFDNIEEGTPVICYEE